MKDTVGEGSMSVATIVIIVAIIAVAIGVITIFITNIGGRANDVGHYCAQGYTWQTDHCECTNPNGCN